ERLAVWSDAGALARGSVYFVAHDADHRHLQDRGHLLGDLQEERFGRSALSHERGYAPQRGLFVGQPLELSPIGTAQAGHTFHPLTTITHRVWGDQERSPGRRRRAVLAACAVASCSDGGRA